MLFNPTITVTHGTGQRFKREATVLPELTSDSFSQWKLFGIEQWCP